MSKIKAWIEKSRELAYKKYSRKIEKVIYELSDGSESDFYIKAEGPAVCILGLTPDNNVILVRQFRPGPNEILDELPGGYVDPNEDPIESAKREFEEETGYSGDFEFIGTTFDDAYSTMLRYCYVAKNCKKIGSPQNSKTEQTEVVFKSLEDFKTHLRSGKLTDIEVGFLGLDYLNL